MHDVSYMIQGKTLLQDITCTIGSNQVISIIGYNGSGKSTLLKLIVGSIEPTKGSIQKSRGVRIGYVPQKLTFARDLPITVHDFIALYNTKEKQQCSFSCSFLDIDTLGKKQLSILSGGQLQKVLIYNALVGSPDILLLDEPTAGLDIVAQQAFYSLIEHIHAEHNISIVLVSHDIHSVYSKSDSIICLHKGVCCTGCPEDSDFSKEITNLLGGYIAPYLHSHHTHDR